MNMVIEKIQIIKRNVKYPRIELKNGYPVLILPLEGDFKPEEIIERHKNWIEEKIKFMNRINKKFRNKKIYERNSQELKKIIQKYIEKFEKNLGVEVKSIGFRNMRTKWASCSSKGKIIFNSKMKFLPSYLIRYIVFHEMVHILIKNHKKNFWLYIKKEFKNPEMYEEKLYGYWFLISQNRPNFCEPGSQEEDLTDWEGKGIK